MSRTKPPEAVRSILYIHRRLGIIQATIHRIFLVTNVTKKLDHNKRWNNFNGIKIQRDIYSAFLIMNVSDDLKNFDIDKCKERFENFYRLHNLEVDRLTGKNNLSSIAI